MANIIRAAVLQTEWTGDKASMIDRHEEQARDAAAQGAQVICFQELFYGPYFCQVQDPVTTSTGEEIPNGPTTSAFSRARELSMVMVLTMYEGSRRGLRQQPRPDRADGTTVQVPQAPHPAVKVSGRSSISARQPRYPVFDTRWGACCVYICYDRHFPEGWRALD